MRKVGSEWPGSVDALANRASVDARLLHTLGRTLRVSYEPLTEAPLPEHLRVLLERLPHAGPNGENDRGA